MESLMPIVGIIIVIGLFGMMFGEEALDLYVKWKKAKLRFKLEEEGQNSLFPDAPPICESCGDIHEQGVSHDG